MNTGILEPMPKRKLADVLAELEPLPLGETLPDVDEGLRPLDRDPLVGKRELIQVT